MVTFQELRKAALSVLFTLFYLSLDRLRIPMPRKFRRGMSSGACGLLL